MAIVIVITYYILHVRTNFCVNVSSMTVLKVSFMVMTGMCGVIVAEVSCG